MNKKALAKIKPWDFVKVKNSLGRIAGKVAVVLEYPVDGDPDYIKVKLENATYVWDVDYLTTEGIAN